MGPQRLRQPDACSREQLQSGDRIELIPADRPVPVNSGSCCKPVALLNRGAGPVGLAPSRKTYFNQPRFLKYHIGTSALANISINAAG